MAGRGRISIAPWSKRGTPREASARPSWIGLPATRKTEAPAVFVADDTRREGPDDSAEPTFVAPTSPSATLPSTPAPPIILSVVPSAVPPGTHAPGPNPRELELELVVATLRSEVARLEGELGALSDLEARVASEAEPELVRLAFAIAERIAGRALALDPDMLIDWVREGLAALPRKAPLEIAAAPDMAAALSDAPGTLMLDEGLAPGTCQLREGPRSVDVGLGARSAAIAAVVLEERS